MILNKIVITLFTFLLLENGVFGQSPLQFESTTGAKPYVKDRETRKPKPSSEIGPQYQLNNTWIPSHYDIKLVVNLEDFKEAGMTNQSAVAHVEIDFISMSGVDHVMVHLNKDFVTNLNFTLKNVTNGVDIDLGTTPGQEDPESSEDTHFWRLNFGVQLTTNTNYRLVIESTAKIPNDRTNGLYLSNYTDANFNVRHIAATQMESYHLRQLFPSFDEPDLKATFKVSIIHKSIYKALANGATINTTPTDTEGWLQTNFETTVKMSTYLFAITVADFDFAEAAPGLFNKPVKTWGDPALIGKGGGQYTADLTARLLDFFDKFLNTTYPMQKMDSAAITHKGGAMENWGLILYRTDLLIYLPGETLETAKNSIASVVSHEVAHQNVGNLVTCKFWNWIWLNEGFATYLSYLGVEEVAPEFKHLEWQINDAMQPALAFDAGPDSHPLKNDALTPEQIDKYFSTITYDKGSSINRMVEGFLGKETFWKGLSLYLDTKQFQGAIQEELFYHLQLAAVLDGVQTSFPSGTNVQTILETWTDQVGHPLVRVNVANDSHVFISQENYINPQSGESWHIPLKIATDANVGKFWLRKEQSNVTMEHERNKWIIGNHDAFGFYRVLYDPELTQLIIDQLEKNVSAISPLSRSQLLDDYFNLAFKGFVNVETALELTTYLEQEDHFTVWEVVFNHLRKSHVFLEDENSFKIFSDYLVPKLEPALLGLGLEQNEEVVGADEILRMKLIDWACSLGHQQCVHHAHQLHGEWESDVNKKIHVDTQATFFCTIVSTGGETGFSFIREKYINLDITSYLAEKTRLLNGLACATNATQIQTLLEWTLESQSGLAPAHQIPLIKRIGMNRAGRKLVIEFLSNKIEEIIQKFGSVTVLVDILNGLSSQLSTQEQLNLVVKLISDNEVKFNELDEANKKTLATVTETIRSNVNWTNQWGKPIINWMEKSLNPGNNNNAGVSRTSTVFLLLGTAILSFALFK